MLDAASGVNEARVNLLAFPSFDPARRVELNFAPGTSVADMLAVAFPEPRQVRVTLADAVIASNQLARWKPKPGTVTVMRSVPSRGQLRSVLLVAVSVAALATGQWYAGALGVSAAVGGAFGASAFIPPALAGAALATGITVAGTLAVNALVPLRPPSESGRSDSATYRIQGWQNVANPNGVVPLILGKHRFAPPFAALPYTLLNEIGPVTLTDRGAWTTATGYVEDDVVSKTVIDGDDTIVTFYRCIDAHTSGATTEPGVGASWETVWVILPVFGGTEAETDIQRVVALFNGGYGPQTRTDYRIGDSDIEQFTVEEIENPDGEDADPAITIYPEQVIEEALGVTLPGGRDETLILTPDFTEPITRFTARDAQDAAVDVFFPEGLGRINGDGEHDAASVEIKIRYRLNGAGAWTDVTPTLVYAFFRDRPFGHTERFTFPARGRYEIEVSRTGTNMADADDVIFERVDWLTLKSFRPEYPIAFDKPLALTAVRMRASKQLQGTLDNLNYDAECICLDWNGSAWVEQETRNPASLFRYNNQGPHLREHMRRTDAELDLNKLAEWHEFCTVKGLEYNRVHDFEASIEDVNFDICAAGRARPIDNGIQLSVVIDQPQTVVIGQISPRNAWDFTIEPGFSKLPDAFLVNFKDETNGYQEAQRVVPRPGLAGDPEIFEEISLPGKTHPDEIWKEARWRWQQLLLRPDVYTVAMDWEHMIFQLGDLVKVAWHTLDRVMTSARIVDVDGPFITLDQIITMDAQKSYAIRFRHISGAEAVTDPPATSILRNVLTVGGETRRIQLFGEGFLPTVGDLAQFGLNGEETRELVVQNIERGESFSARLRLIDHAPTIEALIDADTPPAWDGRVGEIL